MVCCFFTKSDLSEIQLMELPIGACLHVNDFCTKPGSGGSERGLINLVLRAVDKSFKSMKPSHTS